MSYLADKAVKLIESKPEFAPNGMVLASSCQWPDSLAHNRWHHINERKGANLDEWPEVCIVCTSILSASSAVSDWYGMKLAEAKGGSCQ